MSDKLVNVVVAKQDNKVQVGSQVIVLELIDGWDELDDRQQKYLQLYAKDPTGNKQFAAMSLGYKLSEVNKWFNQETFSNVAGDIYDIYTDLLKGIDFKDAINNSKIRARVIQAREAGGKYTKEKKGTPSQHLHLHDFKLSDLLNP